MSEHPLSEYLTRPLSPPAEDTLDAIARGPINPRDALALAEVDRLRNPAPLECETGWCVLNDGVAYVAVHTAMPHVSGEMVDWWFDWHPRESLRYRVWHPTAHLANSLESPPTARAKAHWGTVHHPVEDVGVGVVHARIEFCSPTEMGFASDALDDPAVASIVCGYAGDDRRHVRHTPMYHVFLREGQGVVLRSRFWLGAALAPYGPLGGPAARVINTPFVRRRALPMGLPRALATHCAEEYANLAALLPKLYERFGPEGAPI
jgi:phloretin hydrolase